MITRNVFEFQNKIRPTLLFSVQYTTFQNSNKIIIKEVIFLNNNTWLIQLFLNGKAW